MARPARLFLDAARLGAMSPTAQLAARDFARLAGEGVSTLYWEQFFRGPFARRNLRTPRVGLAGWTGVPGLRQHVREAVAAPPAAPVLFASRATALMQQGVRFAALNCRRILTTDLLWPPYRDLLHSECRRQGTGIELVSIRADVLSGRVSLSEVLRKLQQTFAARSCDGIVVSSVSHDGVRLPLSHLLPAIRAKSPDAVVVIDGAQEFAHAPVDLRHGDCDLYITGCHKWLGAYQPLGIAVLPNARTAARILTLIAAAEDPLLDYLNGLDGRPCGTYSETVNLAPLVTAWAACVDFSRQLSQQRQTFRRQVQQARRLCIAARGVGWAPCVVRPGLRSGIVLLRGSMSSQQHCCSSVLQARFGAAGVLLTAYEDATIRVSLPRRRLQSCEWSLLREVLAVCATGGGMTAGNCRDIRCWSSASSPTASAPTTAG